MKNTSIVILPAGKKILVVKSNVSAGPNVVIREH